MSAEIHANGDEDPILVPVLDLSGGAPDPVALATWHLALSNVAAADVPHQLFALWVFPERGGVVLVGPEALALDQLPVPVPNPAVLTQDQLFEVEEIIRRAKYRSTLAIPIRADTRDVGLLVVACFEPGRLGPKEVRTIRQLAIQMVPSLSVLGQFLSPADAVAPPLEEESLGGAFLKAANDATNGAELVRRLSGLLYPHVPHDRLEIVASGARGAFALSGAAAKRRWGTTRTTWADVVERLNLLAGTAGTVVIDDLASELPDLMLPANQGAAGKIASLIAGRLSLGGESVGWLIAGHAAARLYRAHDEELVAMAAGCAASRAFAFRLESENQAIRGQLEVLQAPSLPVLRAAETLSSTGHLGEALNRFDLDVQELLPHQKLSFMLIMSEGQVVEFDADRPKPLVDLPLTSIAATGLEPVLEGERAWYLVTEHETARLAVPLKVADRIVGAMVLSAGQFDAPREAAAIAQQFATVAAAHLELLRRGTVVKKLPSAQTKTTPV